MVFDLNTLNLALDAIIKLIVLAILIFLLIVLKHLDKAIQRAGRSADSVHGVAKKVQNAMSARNLARMAHGYWKNRGEKRKDEL